MGICQDIAAASVDDDAGSKAGAFVLTVESRFKKILEKEELKPVEEKAKGLLKGILGD